MNRKLIKFSALWTLALGLVFTACENLSETTAPNLAQSEASRFVTATETNCSLGASVTAVVDGRGGNLKVCKHFLTIPPGSVSGPTTFVMTKVNSEIKVDLTATSLGSLVLNDVGAAGFAKPLTLTLNYSDAVVLPADLSSMKIYWLKPDGSREPLASTVDVERQRVLARPTHFSAYEIAWGATDDASLELQ